jgi:hypothetical protein
MLISKKEEKLMTSQLCQIYWFHFNKMIKNKKKSKKILVPTISRATTSYTTDFILPFYFILLFGLRLLSFMQTS